MKNLVYSLVSFLMMVIGTQTSFAQQDTTRQEDLLGELSVADEAPALLPDHMLITQRILWGRHGLMRNFKRFELTPEKRQVELNLRRASLKAHQAIGLLTLGGMVAQGIVGGKLYNGDYKLKDTHEALAVAVNTGYFTTAGLSLFAPPKAIDERRGFSSIKAHRWLAVLHLSGMILTNVLADRIEDNYQLRSVHRAAAFTAFGAYAASIIVIKF
ncbi:MAG: hypothetical protein ACKO3B_13770 [Bacteroidota bacterium]